MEIEVGEYVRTKKRGIFKVLSIRETLYGHLAGITDTDRTFTIGKGGNNEIKNDIVSHSENIIDLIEEGDYVNGEIVTGIKEWKSSKDGFFRYAITAHYEIIRADEIKSILTKEMFASAEYRVETD